MWNAPLVALLLACWGERAYIVEGTVVEVTRPTEIVLDHEEIAGLMGPMIMPFEVVDASLTEGLQPGHRVVARFELLEGTGGVLTKLRITGKGAAPAKVERGPEPVRSGGTLPALTVPSTAGDLVLGPEQAERLAVTFLYTRCPIPEFCPAVVLRMQALQEQIGPGQRILAITLDPAHDSLEVLREFGEASGADPARWAFGRLPPDQLADLALRAGLPIVQDGGGNLGEIVHGLRLLVVDRGGRLIERYDDNAWPLDRVVSQLSTGGPDAPPGSDGTVSEAPSTP